MAKTNKITPADLADMKKDSEDVAKAPAPTNVPLISLEEFNKAKGQKVLGGGNVLKLEQNTAAGPFTVSGILKNQKLSPKYAAVDVHVLELEDGSTFKAPAAQSFRDKAKDSNLSVGDVLLIKRDVDYRANGKPCQSYQLNIISRAKK